MSDIDRLREVGPRPALLLGEVAIDEATATEWRAAHHHCCQWCCDLCTAFAAGYQAGATRDRKDAR